MTTRTDSLKSTAARLLLIAALCLPIHSVSAGVMAELPALSPDITADFASVVVRDQEVFVDQLGFPPVPVSLGGLPDVTAVDAFHDRGDGRVWFSLETWADLNGLSVAPADVVQWDGIAYSLAFDSITAGVPAGANVDAVTAVLDTLMLSFDVAIDVPGGPFFDTDLVLWDGAGFSLVLDTAAAGIPSSLDMDAAHFLTSALYLFSFDGAGEIGNLSFSDEDVLQYNTLTDTWTLIYDGSFEHADWVPADLDALSTPLGQDLIQEVPGLSALPAFVLALLLLASGSVLIRAQRQARR